MPNGDPRDSFFCPTLTLMIESYNISLLSRAMNVFAGLQIRVCIGKLFFLFLIQTYFVSTQKNRLNEKVLLSTQNTCLN